jgi:hypothetical protein
MLVREYLQHTGLTKEQLSEILGHKTTSMVTKKFDVEMPVRWSRKLDLLDGTSTVLPSDEEDTEDLSATPDLNTGPVEVDPDYWDTPGRDSDQAPQYESGETVVGPQRIKLTTVEGYIKMVYGGAATIAKSRGDEIAADTINRYSDQFSEAWIEYIKSNPQFMEYLEKLMIGTPLGNLIGVHVIAVGSYVFARAAAREIGAAFAAEAANDNGASGNPSPDFVA